MKNILENYLTPAEAASIVKRSESTLAKDRSKTTRTGKLHGPRAVNVGGRIYYRAEDLQAWVDSEVAASLGADR